MKKKTPVVNMGSASMLVIFLILCLVTFSILSLSSASSDYNFSKRIAERTTDYYEASNQAEEVLVEIDKIFANSYDGGDYNAYLENVGRQLDAMDSREDTNSRGDTDSSQQISLTGWTLTHDFTGDERTVNMTIPVNEKQALAVTLKLNPPANGGNFYEVTQWQEITTADWEGDTTLPLMEIN